MLKEKECSLIKMLQDDKIYESRFQSKDTSKINPNHSIMTSSTNTNSTSNLFIKTPTMSSK